MSCCGTWSLVGLELERPVIDEASRRANFSNELGVDGTVRFLRNVMGHWMLQECERNWALSGHPQNIGHLARGGGPSARFSLAGRHQRPRILPGPAICRRWYERRVPVTASPCLATTPSSCAA